MTGGAERLTAQRQRCLQHVCPKRSLMCTASLTLTLDECWSRLFASRKTSRSSLLQISNIGQPGTRFLAGACQDTHVARGENRSRRVLGSDERKLSCHFQYHECYWGLTVLSCILAIFGEDFLPGYRCGEERYKH